VYDRFPAQRVSANDHDCNEGWADVGAAISARTRSAQRCVIAVECYPGVHTREVRDALETAIAPALVVDAEDALQTPEKLEVLLRPYLGGDPVFGFMCPWSLQDFFSHQQLDELHRRIGQVDGVVLVIGTGASLVLCFMTRYIATAKSMATRQTSRAATSSVLAAWPQR